jgi:ubiquinone biosynthesis protein UbiJ
VYNSIDDYIADALDDLEEALRVVSRPFARPRLCAHALRAQELTALSRSRRLDSRDEEEVARGCDRLVSRLRSTFDENIDRFEGYVLRNIFNIPDHIAEEQEDEDSSAPVASALTGPTVSAAEVRATKKEVEALQQRLVKVRCACL